MRVHVYRDKYQYTGNKRFLSSMVKYYMYYNSYKGYQMWNAEDRFNKQLEKHLNLTYCLNVTLEILEKYLFWYITTHIINEILKWLLQTTHSSQKWAATIFSTSDPFLLIIHENDRFRYIATDMEYEILKWAPQNDSIELKWAENEPGNIFSSFWPHFIYSAVKLSILMCHTTDFIWNF